MPEPLGEVVQLADGGEWTFAAVPDGHRITIDYRTGLHFSFPVTAADLYALGSAALEQVVAGRVRALEDAA